MVQIPCTFVNLGKIITSLNLLIKLPAALGWWSSQWMTPWRKERTWGPWLCLKKRPHLCSLQNHPGRGSRPHPLLGLFSHISTSLMFSITGNPTNRCIGRGPCVLYRHLDLTVDTSDNAEVRKSGSVSPFCMFALSNQNTLFRVYFTSCQGNILFSDVCEKNPMSLSTS